MRDVMPNVRALTWVVDRAAVGVVQPAEKRADDGWRRLFDRPRHDLVLAGHRGNT
jgi:hypothetical protein